MSGFDIPIKCQTFGAGITIDDGEAAVFLMMGEDPDSPTHGVVLSAEGFNNFINRCLAMAFEMNAVNAELDGLVGSERDERLRVIAERYVAGYN